MSTYTPKRSRRGMRMVVALGLATLAAGGVFLYASTVQRQLTQQQLEAQQLQLAAAAPSEPPRAAVVIARSDLSAGSSLSADAFEVRQLPQNAVTANAVTSLDAIVGKMLNSPMAAGEQLTASRLVESKQSAAVKTVADMIPPGLRAMSLTLTELDGAGGLIVPGQHVDIVAVFKKDTCLSSR
jgi:pilus assembly protein CpaB